MVTPSLDLFVPPFAFLEILVLVLFAFHQEIKEYIQDDDKEKLEEIEKKKQNESILKKIFNWVFKKKGSQKASFSRLINGILSGIIVYSSLMYGTTLHQSDAFLERFIKILALLDGAVLYVVMVALVGMVALYPFITKRDASFFAGVTISFSVFEVWFALRCTETIPFMENIGVHICK